MKKSIVILCIFIILLSVLSACNKNNEESDAETTLSTASENQTSENYETTAPKHTVGDVLTSERFEITDNEYHIAYYDANGAGAKLEVYRNGKLAYYYISSSVDESGNCIQQKYYTADGKYIGAFDHGFFFDENGRQISEDVMESKLNK